MQHHLLRAGLIAAAIATAPMANAFSLDSIKKGAGDYINNSSSQSQPSSTGSSAGLLSALSSGNLDFANMASLENIAGVLGYCQEQGYSKSATDQVKDKLMSKIGGQEKASQSEDYQNGLNGILSGQDNQAWSLGSLKDKAGEKVCGMITDKAVSRFL